MSYRNRPNVIMFMLDTLRASDTYQNDRAENLNRMAKAGISYTNAVSPGTWTATSHASMFAGKPVSSIPEASKDLFINGTKKIDPWFVKTKFLPDQINTIASRLTERGYTTTLFSNNPFLNSMTNLSAGFGITYDLWKETNAPQKGKLAEKASSLLQGGSSTRMRMMDISYSVSRIFPERLLDKIYLDLRIKLDRGVAERDSTYRLDRGARSANAAIKGHMERSKQFDIMPKFYFINYIEAHENYPVSRDIIQDKWLYMSGILELDDRTKKELHKAYLRRIGYLDRMVGKALASMRESGILDDALVVFLSDHGQFFGEHSLLYHSLTPYNEVSNVPLISVRFKNGKPLKEGKVVEEPVSLGRIGNAIGKVVDNSYQNLNGHMFGDVYSEHTGISEGWDEYLLSKLRRRSSIADMIYRAKLRSNSKAVAIYGNKLKLIHFYGKGKDEMYTIEDRNEEWNIIRAHRTEQKEMIRRYAKYLSSHTSLSI